jgi:hypothetical protein
MVSLKGKSAFPANIHFFLVSPDRIRLSVTSRVGVDNIWYPVINMNIFCHLIPFEIAIWACESPKVNCKILGFYLNVFEVTNHEIFFNSPLDIVHVGGRVCLIFYISKNRIIIIFSEVPQKLIP